MGDILDTFSWWPNDLFFSKIEDASLTFSSEIFQGAKYETESPLLELDYVPSDDSQRIKEKELRLFLDISSHPDKLQRYTSIYHFRETP